MVFMSKGIKQVDLRGFVETDATLARFDVLAACLAEALGNGANQPEKRLKF